MYVQILVQNFIIKDILKKKNVVHWISVRTIVNCLFKLAQEKVWLGELTVPPWP